MNTFFLSLALVLSCTLEYFFLVVLYVFSCNWFLVFIHFLRLFLFLIPLSPFHLLSILLSPFYIFLFLRLFLWSQTFPHSVRKAKPPKAFKKASKSLMILLFSFFFIFFTHSSIFEFFDFFFALLFCVRVLTSLTQWRSECIVEFCEALHKLLFMPVFSLNSVIIHAGNNARHVYPEISIFFFCHFPSQNLCSFELTFFRGLYVSVCGTFVRSWCR